MSTTIRLYFMRHGEASWTTPDSDRALTERGIQHTRDVLSRLDRNPEKILSSPYRRARQTAAEAEHLTGLDSTQHPFLTPDESPKDSFEALVPHISNHTLIVAHQPLLGYLVSLLTRGDLADPYPFGTSEVLVMELEAWAPGCGRILRNITY